MHPRNLGLTSMQGYDVEQYFIFRVIQSEKATLKQLVTNGEMTVIEAAKILKLTRAETATSP